MACHRAAGRAPPRSPPTRRATGRGSAPAGAWPRRRELLDAAVKPAAEWARERLAECDEKDGGWEALMGYHHVLEVSERIVEFCEERDEREAP